MESQQSRRPELQPLPAYVRFLAVKVAGTGFSASTQAFPYKYLFTPTIRTFSFLCHRRQII